MITSLKLNLLNLNLKISNGEIFLGTFPKLGLNSSYSYRTSKLPSVSLLSNLLHSTVLGPSFPEEVLLGQFLPQIGLRHHSSVSFTSPLFCPFPLDLWLNNFIHVRVSHYRLCLELLFEVSNSTVDNSLGYSMGTSNSICPQKSIIFPLRCLHFSRSL